MISTFKRSAEALILKHDESRGSMKLFVLIGWSVLLYFINPVFVIVSLATIGVWAMMGRG